MFYLIVNVQLFILDYILFNFIQKNNDFTTPRETDAITPRSARAVFTTPRVSARDLADDFKTPRHDNLVGYLLIFYISTCRFIN